MTWVSDATTAGGLYVGATRGRYANVLHVVAADPGDARNCLVAAIGRDRADRGLDTARHKAAATPPPPPAPPSRPGGNRLWCLPGGVARLSSTPQAVRSRLVTPVRWQRYVIWRSPPTRNANGIAVLIWPRLSTPEAGPAGIALRLTLFERVMRDCRSKRQPSTISWRVSTPAPSLPGRPSTSPPG